MNCYDFVQFYENCSFMEAREKVNQYYMERDPRNLVLYEYSHTKMQCTSIQESVYLIEKVVTLMR